MLLLRRPRVALGSRAARALCTPASAHLAVLQLYRLQPAPVPPGMQPRLLFADGQARSAALALALTLDLTLTPFTVSLAMRILPWP